MVSGKEGRGGGIDPYSPELISSTIEDEEADDDEDDDEECSIFSIADDPYRGHTDAWF